MGRVLVRQRPRVFIHRKRRDQPAYSLDILGPGRTKWERRRGPGLPARSPPRAPPALRDPFEVRTHQSCERTARTVAPSTTAAMGCKALDRSFRERSSAVRPAVPRATVRQSRHSARPRSGHGGAGARVTPPRRSPAPHPDSSRARPERSWSLFSVSARFRKLFRAARIFPPVAPLACGPCASARAKDPAVQPEARGGVPIFLQV